MEFSLYDVSQLLTKAWYLAPEFLENVYVPLLMVKKGVYLLHLHLVAKEMRLEAHKIIVKYYIY